MTTDELWKMAIDELKRSNADRKHPFKQMVLGTSGKYPEIRTVIKRDFDQESHLWLYSDSRAPKVKQILENESTSILFYHQKKRLQVRMKGTSKVHFSGPAFEKHKSIAAQNPKDYEHPNPPGSILAADKSNQGFHFCPIEFIPETIDILLLGREKHFRAIYTLEKDLFSGHFVTP